MSAGFPPQPIYPTALDSDRTLFLVYNTTETITTEDNQPWAEEIYIKPQPATKPEVWADNGFATISGELLYYDDVEKNDDGRVISLIRCARNLGGETTRFNVAGTEIRSFVVAEHHNQIVAAIESIEEFIGINDSTDPDSLDFRIRQIADQADCLDDGNCPTVSFDYSITSTDVCNGTQIAYNISIQGNFNTFRLDFGDGNSTTSTQSSTHLYSPNATIDPVIFIGNDSCQIVITPVQRTESKEPQNTTVTSQLTIPVAEVPTIPTINVPSISVPPTDISIPPIVLPCIDLEPLNLGIGPISIGDISVPSVISIIPPEIPTLISITPISLPTLISITPVTIPSQITFVPPSFPTEVSFIPPTLPDSIPITAPDLPTSISLTGSIPSNITVTGVPETISLDHPVPNTITVIDNLPAAIAIDASGLPSNITITGTIPSTIHITPTIPSAISITGHIPSIISVTGSIPTAISIIGTIPSTITVTGSIPNAISVNWGSAPTVSVNWGSPPTITVNCQCCPSSTTQFAGPLFADEAVDPTSVNVDYEFAGIPSKIMLEVPDIPAVRLMYDDIPPEINVRSIDLPEHISLINTEFIPGEISIIAADVPKFIELDASKMPRTISLISDLPKQIEVRGVNIPSVISVESDIPSRIEVVGMPKTISVVGFPESLKVDPVEMVYKGAPIDVKVQVDFAKIVGENPDGRQCFMLVPCQ